MKTSNGECVSAENNVDATKDAAVENVIAEDGENEDVVVNELSAQDDEVMDEQVEYEDIDVNVASNEEACSVIEKAAAVALQNAPASAADIIRRVTASIQSEIDAEVAAAVYRETAEYIEAAGKKQDAENKKAFSLDMFR